MSENRYFFCFFISSSSRKQSKLQKYKIRLKTEHKANK